MNKRQFIRQVQEISHVPDERVAEEATEVVLHALSHRLTRDESEDVCDQLSMDIKRMWMEDNFILRMVDKLRGSQLTFKNRQQMYDHIRSELQKHKVEVQNLEPFTLAVFHVLKEQISKGEVEDVAAQLPEEIKQMWWAA